MPAAFLSRKTKSLLVQRGVADFEKGWARQALVAPFTEQLNCLITSMDSSTSAEKRTAVEAYFWMIEEFKVSVFAQELGTDGPVSVKRLNKPQRCINVGVNGLVRSTG